MKDFYHFLNSNKSDVIIKEQMLEYQTLLKKLLKENNLDNKEFKHLNLEHFLKNCFIYLENEINKLNKQYKFITICEKYAEYITFVFLKNKNIPKKKFKIVLMDLNEQLQIRDGGDIINIQFKDINMLIYIHKNVDVE